MMLLKQARAALKLPDRNHVESDAAGACDRFVLTHRFQDSVSASLKKEGAGEHVDWDTLHTVAPRIKPPLPCCWIETGADASVQKPDGEGFTDAAWFIEDDEMTFFIPFSTQAQGIAHCRWQS